MATRWSLARRAIAFTSASVGLRSISRSVSRTKGLASCNVDVGVGMSCNMSGSSRDAFLRNKKGRPVSRLPFGALFGLRRFNRTRQTPCVHRLLGRGFRHREYRHESAAASFCTKLDMTLDLGEQGMVRAHADIKAGMARGAALALDDVTGNDVLAAVGLDPEPLARRITPVTR